MENHIFKHWSQQPENKLSLFEMIEILNNLKYATSNNETDKKYLNAEDNRMLNKEHFIFASEIGLKITTDKETACGECLRRLFFTLNNFTPDESKTYKDIFDIEKNNNTKENFLNMFRISDLVLSEKIEFMKRIRGIAVKQVFDFEYIDPTNDEKKFVLMKPVNDSAVFIKDNIFNKYKETKPLPYSYPELFITGKIFGAPFYVQYIGKEYYSFKEMKVESTKDSLIIDDKEEIKIDLKSVIDYLEGLKVCMSEGWIPEMSYVNEIGQESDLLNLEKLGIINWMTKKQIYENGPQQPWTCTVCKFNKTCKGLENENRITEHGFNTKKVNLNEGK